MGAFWGQCIHLENLFKSIQTQPQSDTSRVLRSFRPTFVATSLCNFSRSSQLVVAVAGLYLAPGSQFLCPFMLSVAVLAVPGSHLRLAWVSGFWHLGLGTGS